MKWTLISEMEDWAGECEIKAPCNDVITVFYPALADLAISKLSANREKDIEFVSMLLENEIVTSWEIERYIPVVSDDVKRILCGVNLRIYRSKANKNRPENEAESRGIGI